MRLHQITPNYVHQTWPAVAGFLASALEHSTGEYDVDQLKVLVAQGNQLLIVVADDDGVHGALTVAPVVFPNMHVAYITAVGGRLISDKDLFEQFKSWCRSCGFTHIRGAARESVARLWRQRFGYREIYRTVEYAL